MELLYLCITFAVIIAFLALRRPLYEAMAGGSLATALLFRIPPVECLRMPAALFTSRDAVAILLSLYLITWLQQMMEARSLIKMAQADLNGLFHNRRVNAGGASLFMGLMPSAAATLLCGDIVKDSAGDYLPPREQAFIASWFRHIPESTLPTYTGVLLMTSLSGVALPGFLLGMLAPLCVLTALGWLFGLRKLPKDPGTPVSQNRLLDLLHLVQHLWPLGLILALILAFGVGVVPAVLAAIAALAVAGRFSPRELLPMLPAAFDWKLLLNTYVVLVLKEYIAYTGVLNLLPKLLGRLPIPSFLVFALLFFLGGIVSGTNGIIALGTPLAFAAIPDGGAPLMVLLMCMCHAASQVSPTHVCLAVATDYFHISMGQLIRKTVPVSLLFCLLMILYYLLLTLLF